MTNRYSPWMTAPMAVAACALLLAACGDDTDNGTTPDTGTTEDVLEDPGPSLDTEEPDTAEPDTTAPDVAEDTAPDTTEPDATEDVIEDTDGSDDTSQDVVEDTEPEPEPEPVAEPCTTASDCTLPYTCIADYCRLTLQARTFVEDEFSVTQPEEVSRLFDIFKSIASNVKFIALEVAPTRNPDDTINALYGAADVVTPGDPMQVRRQIQADGPFSVVFEPVTSDDGPGDGKTWQTHPFQLNLSAVVNISFGGSNGFYGLIGFTAEQLVLTVKLSDLEADAEGIARGYVTRQETIDRTLTSVESFMGFASIFCPENRSYVPEDGMWKLSDVLDCNNAVMDYDIDGDGENDSYYTEIRLSLVPAVLVP